MELKITGTLILDLGDHIEAIEAVAGAYMLPNPEGLFLPGQCEPVLYKDRPYFYADHAIDNVVIPRRLTSLDMITQDVYDGEANLVVAKSQLRLLKPKARYSMRARNMLVEIIDHLIRNHARWSGTQAHVRKHANAHAAIRPFLLEQFQRSGVLVEGVFQYPTDPNHPMFVWGKAGDIEQVQMEFASAEEKANFYVSEEICDAIMLHLQELVEQLLRFLGPDRWIMHFVKVNNTTLTVERTIDFRIYDWMRRFGSEHED